MNAVGIIAEYNPLHNGHVLHMEKSINETGADSVIVAMSGDYVQRGEPAILDKWERTEHALKCGADIVIEIPVLFSLGNARQFASAGVRLLEATGKVSKISFGSESGDAETLVRIAGTLRDYHNEIERYIHEYSERGSSYPAARTRAYAEMRAGMKGTDPDKDPEILSDLALLNNPNDILAIEYIKAMCLAEPVVIHREGAGYGDPFDNGSAYQSASALRSCIFDGRDVSGFVPTCTYDSLINDRITGPDHDEWSDILRYAILSKDISEIEDFPSGGEGLAYSLKSKAMSAVTWSELIKQVKSKRYTYTRLSRLCMQLMLGISRTKYDMDMPLYIRILGFTERGRKLLAEMRDEACTSLPVVINVNKTMPYLDEKAKKLLELDIHASDIYNLMTGRDLYTSGDRMHAPLIMK